MSEQDPKNENTSIYGIYAFMFNQDGSLKKFSGDEPWCKFGFSCTDEQMKMMSEK